MEKDRLQELLDKLPVPTPGEDARKRASRAAIAEFNRRKSADEKKIKGFSLFSRLTGKKLKGDPVMSRSIAVSAGIAVSVILVGIIALPNFVSYRKSALYMRAPATMETSDGGQTSGREGVADSASRLPGTPTARLKRQVQPPASPQMQAYRESEQTVESAADPQLSVVQRPSSITTGFAKAEKERPKRPLSQEYVGRDQFESFAANPVKQVSRDPVSTFSIDVDTASYAFVRRALKRGTLPRKDAVRIEELINYFDYDYPLPGDRTAPFKSTVAVFPTPWNPDTQLLHIGIKGYDIKRGESPRSNLVFLIDVSGSMGSDDKLPLLKNAFRMLVESLEATDTVAMVVYAGAAGTVLEPTSVGKKGKILDALNRLRAGGSTAGGEGIRRAYALAEANFDPDGVNRVILATDGDFNVGIRNPDELQDFVERKRQTGIYLSVLGFGQGNYNDALMQKLAQNGNGNAAYIDNLAEARKVLADEAHATLFTIAKDVKIQIEFNPARVSEYRLIGYETRLLRQEDFNNDRVDAGDVGAGHSVTAIYEITPVGSDARLIDDLRYGKTPTEVTAPADIDDEIAFLKIRYKLPDATKSRLITTPVGPGLFYDTAETAPVEARFASAVAAFGQLLRGDPYVKDATYDDVLSLARSARGEDHFGYRAEFLSLVRLAKTARAMGDR
jgi:Ca-activated chloride channel family protein